MDVFNYSPHNQEYLGVSQADESPLEPGIFLLPGNATIIAPPAPVDGFARVWDEEEDEWTKVPDHRGEIWHAGYAQPVEIAELGNPADWGLFEDEPADPNPVVDLPPLPILFASAGFVIANGTVTGVELAAQLQGAIYEDGWLMVMFAQPQDSANYLVFAQTDVPAKIEQFKDTGSFELVFSDANGDPIEPGRIDLQILKVR